jgi:molybdate transport system ATP-binding protein
MNLSAQVAIRLGDFELDVSCETPASTVTAVLGPNGAGKTTLLRCIAGAVAIDRGRIALDDRVLDQPPSVFVPPERRHLGLVHQGYLLFPHLTALDNVAFGLRCRGASTGDARCVAEGWLRRVGVAAEAGARPTALSGGQAQRVALARALATEPAALLLDEPLAALDAGTRVDIRRDLRRYLADYPGPTVLVTHDPIDALALADRVVVLERGRVSQAGPLAEVTARPRSRYVAELIGTNLLVGTAAGTEVTTAAGTAVTVGDPHDGPVFATVAPSAIALHHGEPEGSPRNRWPTVVTHLEPLGDRVRVGLGPPLEVVAEITAAAVAELELREGGSIWASVKATEIAAYPR